MTARPAKIGVIGAGNISGIYLQAGQKFDILDIVAVADLDMERARTRAAEYNIPRACTVDELLDDTEIEIVLNLTVPKAHGEIGLAALEAGKHIYNEKPLALNRQEGRRMLDLARARGLRVGCAPDTFLGGGIQTCRKLIDDGWIGEPVAASAFFASHGGEAWHPDPEFFYQPGAGPMLDMGPYYVTALAVLIGPIRRVAGAARITFPERLITSQPKYGTTFTVNTPTHITGVMEFASGALGTIITSFDVWAAELPRIEIYGSEGSLSVPDPNTFGGPVRLRRAGASEWSDVPLTYGFVENSRGLGLADMAHAIRSGRPHRASGELAFHVLDAMQGFLDAAQERTTIELSTKCERPAPLPLGLGERRLDD